MRASGNQNGIRWHRVLGLLAAVCAVWFGTAIPALARDSKPRFDAAATPVVEQDRYRSVTAGGQHACALHDSGRVQCWGRNHQGQVEVPTGVFRFVAAGDDHTCGLLVDEQLSCWGGNRYGQASPPPGTFRSVAAGDGHSCAVDTAGQVHCWGLNDQGQADPPQGQFVVVAAGDAVSCALNSGNQVACWGRIFIDVIPEAQRFVTLSAAGAVCGLTDTRGVACWGTTSGRFFDLSPSIGDRDLLLDIAVGNKHTCAIRLDGSVDCWGDHLYGQTAVPTGRYTDIAAGDLHSCGVREDGSLACWGANSFRQSEPPPMGAAVPARATFPFTNLTNHWDGKAAVQRRGKTVAATISASRSPVQYVGRQAPSPLLVLPEAWRPAIDIEWQVAGQPVSPDGRPDPSRQQVRNFTIHVGTNGAVTVVDNEQLDGVGFLRFKTRLAWPRQGSEPDVCGRSADAQTAILAAMRQRRPQILDCGQVTWPHLAAIEEFGLPDPDGGLTRRVSVNRPDDLTGMHGLRSANLFLDYSLPTDLLMPAPDLRILRVSGGYLHGDYFVHTPHLPVLPADLLDHTPRLASLTLATYTLTKLPERFLAPVPELRELRLSYTFPTDPPGSWWDFAPVPADLFAFTPGLQSLVLWVPHQQTLPANLFESIPLLRELKLTGGTLTSLSPALLKPLAGLELLHVDIERSEFYLSSDFDGLPGDFLAGLTRLREVDLTVSTMKLLPKVFLTDSSDLEVFRLSIMVYIHCHCVIDNQGLVDCWQACGVG